jgi:hypothetical protein
MPRFSNVYSTGILKIISTNGTTEEQEDASGFIRTIKGQRNVFFKFGFIVGFEL